ncbi:hypothetical protein [Streptomyces sp. DH37]|uniref:hypothetical protein n=1 Tax=Streptomyces sp. DH37 TaxID=3040122 RepID=UPI0024430178|nr:hypothetical protein [Streptomyces sp. DH37]MDG9705549.1 hypothetical protein [Streptomyces sp. DH37]
MRAGDKLRFRGPAGAEFVVTVGAAFDQRTIQARIDSGEWTPIGEKRRAPRKAAAKRTAAKKTTSPPPADSGPEE